MKSQQNSYTKLWAVGVNSSMPCDEVVAKLLDIDYDTYIKILKKHGAHLDYGNSEYWFNSKEEVEVLIKELEPYYILAKLME